MDMRTKFARFTPGSRRIRAVFAPGSHGVRMGSHGFARGRQMFVPKSHRFAQIHPGFAGFTGARTQEVLLSTVLAPARPGPSDGDANSRSLRITSASGQAHAERHYAATHSRGGLAFERLPSSPPNIHGHIAPNRRRERCTVLVHGQLEAQHALQSNGHTAVERRWAQP